MSESANDQSDDTKEKTGKGIQRYLNFYSKILPQICEAIAVNATEDRKWISIAKVKAYLTKYFYFTDNSFARYFTTCIKDMEKHKVIVRKANSITFLYSETDEVAKEAKKTGRKKKENKNPEDTAISTKKFGPEVRITRSGRVSVVRIPGDDDIL